VNRAFERQRHRILKRRRAWKRLLLDEAGKPNPDAVIVLADLARFCRAHRSTAIHSPVSGMLDPLASSKVDGRREVWLRIVENLHLDERFLVNLREGPTDD